MHEGKLGDRVRIQYAQVDKPCAATSEPADPKVLEFAVGSNDSHNSNPERIRYQPNRHFRGRT